MDVQQFMKTDAKTWHTAQPRQCKAFRMKERYMDMIMVSKPPLSLVAKWKGHSALTFWKSSCVTKIGLNVFLSIGEKWIQNSWFIEITKCTYSWYVIMWPNWRVVSRWYCLWCYFKGEVNQVQLSRLWKLSQNIIL